MDDQPLQNLNTWLYKFCVTSVKHIACFKETAIHTATYAKEYTCDYGAVSMEV